MIRFNAVVFGLCVPLLGASASAGAQPLPPTVATSTAPELAADLPSEIVEAPSPRTSLTEAIKTAQPGGQTAWAAEGRACNGCPRKRVGLALIEVTVINGLYELANLARGQVTAEITPKTWWANMKQGWVWDLDDFGVNQIGHPYQGNNYFTNGRGNGLSYYESAALTAFGSGTWEYFGETNHASVNDFINTTMGGIALGEMFHRVAWLVRNPSLTGKKRFWNEFGAMAIDPGTGLNRMLVTGEARQQMEKPATMIPSRLGGVAAAGVLWRGSESRAVDATGQPFLEFDALYGDLDQRHSRTPFEGFTVRGRLGGGSPISEMRVRGRLFAEPFANDKTAFSVVQSYDFQKNDAYATGAQSVEALVDTRFDLSPSTVLRLGFWGGVTVLGAIDSLPLGLEEIPEEEEPEDGGAGQGVSEGPRYYDYGPGSTFGGSATAAHDGRVFAVVAYEGRQIYSLDGVRANHLLQRIRLDLLAPLRGPLGLGVTGEYLDRRTWYQDPASTKLNYQYPQFRVYLTWSR